MSKEKKNPVESQAVETQPVVASVSPPQAIEKLSDVDKLNLDLAKTKRQTALAEAKTALANNENAELQFKYLVLQLYMKYGLNQNDALSENGDIVRGGAVQGPQGQ